MQAAREVIHLAKSGVGMSDGLGKREIPPAKKTAPSKVFSTMIECVEVKPPSKNTNYQRQ
jgi:hypothetical protein